MQIKNEVVAVVPVKRESKGIPGKNKQIIFGQPMFWKTVVAGIDSDVDRVLVPTDDPDVIDHIRELESYEVSKIEVIEREDWLSLDVVQVDAVVYVTMLAFSLINGYIPKTTVVLQPTSPFRGSEHVSNALSMYQLPSPPSADYPASVMSMSAPDKFAYRVNGPYAEPIQHDPLLRAGRQEYDTDEFVLLENGAIYIVDTMQLFKYKTFRVPPIVPFLMLPINSIEIDTDIDLMMAKTIGDNIRLSGIGLEDR